MQSRTAAAANPAASDTTPDSAQLSRRQFTALVGVTVAGLLSGCKRDPSPPGEIKSDRPKVTDGVMSGDVSEGSAVIWSRTNRPARMSVEYSTTESFRESTKVTGPLALPESDFTAKVILNDLPAGQRIFYRVTFTDLSDRTLVSAATQGQFRTPSLEPAPVRFLWSGDVCGQGFGINPNLGGMRIFDTMRSFEPDFFINSGDNIYADQPIHEVIQLPDGRMWRNVVTEAKSEVATKLDQFRGNYRYNLADDNVRAFNGQVAQIVQWDDHETVDNFAPGMDLRDRPEYEGVSIQQLSARAKRAFMEYTPIKPVDSDPGRIYHSFQYGPMLEVFRLDERSYRGPNSPNRQAIRSGDTAFLGDDQLSWLKEKLLASKATWKVISSDQPIGLIIPDGELNFESFANGDGPPLGRELEVADLLLFLKRHNIENVVWLTGDVHHAAAHFYDPSKARFVEFKPFWEFVAGPLNAATFLPDELDPTFGPQVKFRSTQPGDADALSPLAGKQYFGMVAIEPKDQVMTVSLHDATGLMLYKTDLIPVRHSP